MKLILLISLSILFLSCSSDKRVETCTYNGRPIDCSELNGRRNQGPVEEPEELNLSSSINLDAAIVIERASLRILENAEVVDHAQINSTVLTCGMRLNSDQLIYFSRMNDNAMVFRNLKNLGERLEFKRISGEGILGIWENNNQESRRVSTKTIIHIQDNQIIINMTCNLK